MGLTLAKFCADRGIPQPETPLRHQFRPASPEEAGLFYALPPEKDEELGAIGHVRMDFGHSGEEFWHTWWPRGPEELNTREFKEELCKVVDDLRKGVLKDLRSMRGYCCEHDGMIQGGSVVQNYGYVLKTDRYVYRLRCNPTPGDYQAYLSCFVNQEQKMGLMERGLQKMRDAADPNLSHSYDWYVMESCNTPGERFTEGLSLEDAIWRYTTSEHEDKRLGVTKDDILESALDVSGGLLIHQSPELSERLPLCAFPIQEHGHKAQHFGSFMLEIVHIRSREIRFLIQLIWKKRIKFLLQLMVLHVVQQPQGCAQQETGRRAEMLC